MSLPTLHSLRVLQLSGKKKQDTKLWQSDTEGWQKNKNSRLTVWNFINLLIYLLPHSLWPPGPGAPESCWSSGPGRPCRDFRAGRCRPRICIPRSWGLGRRRSERLPKLLPDKLKNKKISDFQRTRKTQRNVHEAASLTFNIYHFFFSKRWTSMSHSKYCPVIALIVHRAAIKHKTFQTSYDWGNNKVAMPVSLNVKLYI